MKPRPARRGRGLALLGLALVIAKLLVTGQMAKYMTPALDPLSALAAVILAVMGLVELAAARGPASVRTTGDGRLHDPDGPEAHGGGTEEALTHLLIGLIILGGLLVAPRALDSSDLAGERVAGLILRFTPGSGPAALAGALPTAAPLDDVDAVWASLRTSDAGPGQRVRVTGTVTRSDDLGPGEFALLRYSIAHCVADARPVALLIVAARDADVQQWQQWQQWGADQWVEVEGVLAARERAGERLVTVEAARVRPIEEPGNPYLPASY